MGTEAQNCPFRAVERGLALRGAGFGTRIAFESGQKRQWSEFRAFSNVVSVARSAGGARGRIGADCGWGCARSGFQGTGIKTGNGEQGKQNTRSVSVPALCLVGGLHASISGPSAAAAHGGDDSENREDHREIPRRRHARRAQVALGDEPFEFEASSSIRSAGAGLCGFSQRGFPTPSTAISTATPIRESRRRCR